MANIREELTLIDRFTAVFNNFISLGDTAATQSEAVQVATDSVSQTFAAAAANSETLAAAYSNAGDSMGYWTDKLDNYDKSAMEAIYTTEELVELGYKTADALKAEANAMTNAADKQQKLNDTVDDAAKGSDKASDAYKRQEKSAQEASKGGLDMMLKKLSAIGAAYLSIQKVKGFISDALKEDTYELKFQAMFGDDATGSAAMDSVRNTALNMGRTTAEVAKATSDFMKVTTQPANLDKFNTLVDRLAWFTEGNDFGQMGDSLQNAFMQGSTSLLASTTDISQQILDKFKVVDFIEKGDVGGALEALEKAADAAGITKEAYDKLMEGSGAKWSWFTSNIQNAATRSASAFIQAFAPAFDSLNAWFNSDKSAKFFGTMAIVMGIAGKALAILIDNFDILAPIIGGVVTAMLLYKVAIVAINIVQGISNLLNLESAVTKVASTGATLAATGATTAQTAAQWGLNAALLASPITWIILAIIALIVIIYTVVAAVNKFAGTSVSATGIVFGAFAVLGAFLWDLFLGVFELILGVINALINPFIQIANFIGNVFTSPVSSIIYLFQSMADGVLAILQKIASALDFVFGSKMSETVGSWRAGLKDMADAAVKEYAPNENYKNVMDELDLSVDSLGLKRINYGDARNAGYAAGENLGDSFNIDNLLNQASGAGKDSDFGGSEGIDKIGSVGEVGKIKDDVSLADEDLKMLVDMAERDYVAKVNVKTLSPNVGVQVTNNNGEKLDEGKIANALRVVLEEQVAMHTDSSYVY